MLRNAAGNDSARAVKFRRTAIRTIDVTRNWGSILKTKLLVGDCIELMAALPVGSVDLILCDLPYGITDCSWDKKIPLDRLWRAYSRVLKDSGACILFAQQPFTTELASGAMGTLRLRYEWVWDKGAATGYQNAKKMPMRRHESILVFYRRLPAYNPQGLTRIVNGRTHQRRKTSEVYGRIGLEYTQQFSGYPTSIVAFRREKGALPCQKPVELLKYLIRTYSNDGETVLDNCMGTGGTGVAALATGRKFIGMELDPERFEIARARIEAAKG